MKKHEILNVRRLILKNILVQIAGKTKQTPSISTTTKFESGSLGPLYWALHDDVEYQKSLVEVPQFLRWWTGLPLQLNRGWPENVSSHTLLRLLCHAQHYDQNKHSEHSGQLAYGSSHLVVQLQISWTFLLSRISLHSTSLAALAPQWFLSWGPRSAWES